MEIVDLLKNIPSIRAYGLSYNYQPETTHKDVMYFDTDNYRVLLNGECFGENIQNSAIISQLYWVSNLEKLHNAHITEHTQHVASELPTIYDIEYNSFEYSEDLFALFNNFTDNVPGINPSLTNGGKFIKFYYNNNNMYIYSATSLGNEQKYYVISMNGIIICKEISYNWYSHKYVILNFDSINFPIPDSEIDKLFEIEQ